jgi:hypothetical protein
MFLYAASQWMQIWQSIGKCGKSLVSCKIATGIAKQSVLVHVLTLLSVIGEDATKSI